MEDLYFVGFLISVGMFFFLNFRAMRRNAAKPFWEQRRHKTPIRVESFLLALIFYVVWTLVVVWSGIPFGE